MERNLRLAPTVSAGWRPWIRSAALGLAVAGMGLTFGAAGSAPAHADVSGTSMSVPLAENAPERYVVRKGDTLWDIAAVFLRDPFYWPEIWYVNPAIANPHLIYPEVEKQRKALEVERAAIVRGRDALAARLSGALGKVAQTDDTARGLVVSLSGGILFDTGKSELKQGAKITLAKLAGILLMMGDSKAQIEGHTDATGSAETNDKLSLARANSVMSFLAEQGVEAGRMTAAGLGSTRPVGENDTADNRAKNRRVEIVLTR